MIFDKLDDLKDLFTAGSACKRFRELIKLVKITSLSIELNYENTSCFFDRDDKRQRCFNDIFLFTNEPINTTSTFLTSNDIKVFKSSSVKMLLCKVRKLSISYLRINVQSAWGKFQSFVQSLKLEQLQIDYFEVKGGRQLKLDDVQILSILHFHGSLSISAPKLTKLYYKLSWRSSLCFVYPETVIHLMIRELGSHHERFINTEYLYFKKSWTSTVGTIQRLFPRVKEIHSRISYHSSMVSQINQKIELKSDLKLYYSNFLINDLIDVDDLYDNHDHMATSRRVVENYPKLSDKTQITYIKEIDYNELIQHFSFVPLDFSSRFVKIKSVTVANRIENQPDFIQFLKGCGVLNRLDIHECSLDQTFFNELSVYCPYITKLFVYENERIDSSFITKFTYLDEYSINHPMPFDLIKLAFNSLKRFKQVCFVLKEKVIDFRFDRTGTLKISSDNTCSYDKKQFMSSVKNIFQLAVSN